MQRDFNLLRNAQFDLLVIGGGIAGLATAWDATRRGLKTCLVEGSDFGSGASQGCFKIVHGGLRYLQHLDFSRLNRSVKEQQVLRRIAPHLIKPLPILVPCYGYGMKGREALRAGLFLYEQLSRGRNDGVDAEAILPNHEVLSVEEVLRRAPHIKREGLRGGVVFYDGQMSNCDRLTLSFALSAAKAGAVLLNYAKACSGKVEKLGSSTKKLTAVEVEDVLSGECHSVSARYVVDATGPWTSSTKRALGIAVETDKEELFSKGIQVVIPKKLVTSAVAIDSPYSDQTAQLARGSRSYFLVPWRSATLVGTADYVATGKAESFSYSKEEVISFVEEVRSAYPEAQLVPENVSYVFGGLRLPDPKAASSFDLGGLITNETVGTAKEDLFEDFAKGHSSIRVDNFLSVAAVKYTTGRYLGEMVVDRVCQALGVRRKCDTESTLLEGAPEKSLKELRELVGNEGSSQWSQDVVLDKIANYGRRSLDILAIMKESPAFAEVIDRESNLSMAEVAYVVRHEMAQRLEDVVFRRTPLGVTVVPRQEVLAKVANFMAVELGWSNERTQDELAAVGAYRWSQAA